jgi:hypothetical protein
MMNFKVADTFRGDVTRPEQLDPMLARIDLEDNAFAVMEADEDNFIQTFRHDDGYVVEVRDGEQKVLYQAVRKRAHGSQSPERFSRDEVSELFKAYLANQRPSSSLTWKPIMTAGGALTTRIVTAACLALMVVILVAIPIVRAL